MKFAPDNNNVIRSEQQKTKTTTSLPNYSPRFTNANRIPIFQFEQSFNTVKRVPTTTRTITFPPNYSPRFSNSNRIPILQFGQSVSLVHSVPTTTASASTVQRIELGLMTHKVTTPGTNLIHHHSVFPVFKIEPEDTSKVYSTTIQELTTTLMTPLNTPTPLMTTTSDISFSTPVPTTLSTPVPLPNTQPSILEKLKASAMNQSNFLTTNPPRFITSTPLPIPKASKKPPTRKHKQLNGRYVYGILPNNTVIKKFIPDQQQTTENPFIITGIFPNKTVVRKFRNGTIVPDEPMSHVEITNIDPISLTDPNSDLYREEMDDESTEFTSTLPTTVMTSTSPTTMVFYLLIVHSANQ